MGVIYRRPVVSFCIMMITGITAAFLSDSLAVVVGLFVLLSAMLFTSTTIRMKGLAVPCAMLAFFLLGALEFMAADHKRLSSFSGYNGTDVVIRGVVISEPEIKGRKVSCIVRANGVKKSGENGFADTDGAVMLSTLFDSNGLLFDYGSSITFEGRLTVPGGARNPGGFDHDLYLAQKGAGASVFAYPYAISAGERTGGNFFVRLGLLIRKRIVDVIEKSLPRQQAGLMNGMLIGYRGGLTDEVKEAFSDAGLLHVMAVSGANVAFLAAPLSFLLKMLRIRKRAANLVIIAFLNLFACVAGFEPSVLRAVLMACVLLLAAVIYREPDIYTSIAVSCIIMLVLSPYMLFNIGFQLSYAATLSIVMLYGNISRAIRCRFIPKKTADVIAATLAAQIGVLPLTIMHFNKVSVISLIPNILAAPMLGVITVLGALMAVLGQFSLTLSVLIGYVNNILLSAVLYITKWSASLPWATFRMVTPPAAAVIIYYMMVLYLLWYAPLKGIKLKLKHVSAVLLLSAAVCLMFVVRPACLEVVFLDVGQGDSTFIRTSSGMTVLVDGGGSSNPDVDSGVGELTVVPFLLDSGVASLDAVIATHAHTDHTQGLMDVMEMLGVRNLIIPSLDDEACFAELLELAGNKGIPVTRCSSGMVINLDRNTSLYVLNPEARCKEDEDSLNNTSLVLRLCYKDISLLFMGDAEKEVEEKLANSAFAQLLDADVIKIGHHGSATSTGESFIEAVDPVAAVISTGRNNFGHPSKKVLRLLEEKGIRYFRTDECGAVLLKSDGKRIRIRGTIGK
ncbi:MAG TPA: DNA internalization-related competence protein ComEC/Rec2 [Clostridiales bacterium]|nr:DNA internalization-related competence protein ComEC/Rec2 [Clostridiales bacterium]